MKRFPKTLLTSALVTVGIVGFNSASAVEWAINGELAVELTDSDANDDLDLDVTTTDVVLTVSEKFGEVNVEGFIAYELRRDDDGDADGLTSDGAGITVTGGFGSVFVGDDGTGVFVGDATDVLYNNSDIGFFKDPTTNVIDYAFPIGEPFSLNIFVDITDGDQEDIDASGFYGSYAFKGFTFALGYTVIADEGAYGEGADEDLYDDIVDLFVGYEAGPISAGAAYQSTEVTDEDYEVVSLFLTYKVGAFSITPYYSELETEGGDNDVIALNVSYNFTDNFYAFFETADYDSDDSDNTEIGLVLTF